MSGRDAGYFLRVFSLSMKYTAIFACGLHNPNSVLPSLPAYAAVAALIEDIRESPRQIVSAVALASARYNLLELSEKLVVVRRGNKPGKWWTIEALHMPEAAVLLPRRLFTVLTLAARTLHNGSWDSALQSPPCSSPADCDGFSL